MFNRYPSDKFRITVKFIFSFVMVYLSATVWRGCRHFVLFAEICYFVKRPTQNSAGSPHTAVFLRHRYFFKCFLNSLHGITRLVFINFYCKKELTSKSIFPTFLSILRRFFLCSKLGIGKCIMWSFEQNFWSKFCWRGNNVNCSHWLTKVGG